MNIAWGGDVVLEYRRLPGRRLMAAPYEPTLVLGIAERISIGAFLLWVAVLAVALWRTSSVQPMPQRPQG